ncbi:hypothetical protein OSTOST_02823 [Ostertagia ostertagi]
MKMLKQKALLSTLRAFFQKLASMINAHMSRNCPDIYFSPHMRSCRKLFFYKILKWFDKFHLIPAEQHGFIPGASTCTNMIETLYDLCKAVNDDIPLNVSKCKTMQIGYNGADEYRANGSTLSSCELLRDLGVIFTSISRFSNHIDLLVKIHATFYMIFRNVRCSDPAILLRLYKSYVLPHLEYCSQFIRRLWYRTRTNPQRSDLSSYIDRLRNYSLKSLQYRRTISDLVLCFRILRRDIKLPTGGFWIFRPTASE